MAFATRCCQPIRTNSVRTVFRCQLAELSLDHFQRLCDSSLSLLRANAGNSNDGAYLPDRELQFQNLSPPSKTAVSLHRHNHVQEAGQLLANAACRWAVEDIDAASAADYPDVESSSITLLDEIHRLRLQLSMQHTRVINSYAEGLKKFTAQQRLSGTT